MNIVKNGLAGSEAARSEINGIKYLQQIPDQVAYLLLHTLTKQISENRNK